MAIRCSEVLNDRYAIQQNLGQGGFSVVYLARDLQDQREVAIKEMVPPPGKDTAWWGHIFRQEVRIGRYLKNARIIQVYDRFSCRDAYYIVMEYVSGGSLADWIKNDAAWSQTAAVRLIGEACEGLAYAHQNGVVHCDIKPTNVLLTDDGHVKIADFGLAHVAEYVTSELAGSTSWRGGADVAAGTLYYMAPEQLGGKRNDPRIDVYALGAMLHQLLAGRPYLEFDLRPTPEAHANNVTMIKNNVPQPLVARDGQPVTEPLQRIVRACLAKQPRERYYSAGEMGQALNAWLSGAGTTERAPDPQHRDGRDMTDAASPRTHVLPEDESANVAVPDQVAGERAQRPLEKQLAEPATPLRVVRGPQLRPVEDQIADAPTSAQAGVPTSRHGRAGRNVKDGWSSGVYRQSRSAAPGVDWLVVVAVFLGALTGCLLWTLGLALQQSNSLRPGSWPIVTLNALSGMALMLPATLLRRKQAAGAGGLPLIIWLLVLGCLTGLVLFFVRQTPGRLLLPVAALLGLATWAIVVGTRPQLVYTRSHMTVLAAVAGGLTGLFLAALIDLAALFVAIAGLVPNGGPSGLSTFELFVSFYVPIWAGAMLVSLQLLWRLPWGVWATIAALTLLGSLVAPFLVTLTNGTDPMLPYLWLGALPTGIGFAAGIAIAMVDGSF